MLFDCIIIGGGPAGLTSAIYLARFMRNVVVFDSGTSRARYIPVSHNYPGFSEGISGHDFLLRLKEQAEKYGARIIQSEVTDLALKNDGTFAAKYGDATIEAKTVILAAGMVDERPSLPGIKEFVYDGVVRFCPICDGFEALDKRVGIIGPCHKIYKKALFLRIYTSKLYIFPTDDDFNCNEEDKAALQSLGIDIPYCKVSELLPQDTKITAVMEDGQEREVDVLYPAMGAEVRSKLAQKLGAKCNESGCLYADAHQQTNIKNLYAIGDITLDLSQISVATGQASIAATAVHNSLPLNCR